MLLLTRAISFIALFYGLAVAGYAQTVNQSANSSGAIGGRVTINGQALAGVIVRLQELSIIISIDGPRFIEVKTDQTGRYLASNVPAGSYYIAPNAPGLVITNHTEFWQFKQATVAPGKTVANVDFTLARGGAITGRVLNAAGQPMVATEINCERYNEDTGEWAPNDGLFNTTQVRTDERGAYRLDGLPPGNYRVGAYHAQYLTTYHPAVTKPERASLIAVRLAEEAANVDIRFGRTLASYSVTGRVIDSQTGEPLVELC